MRIPYLGLLALGPGTGNSESVVELETHILDELEKGSGRKFFSNRKILDSKISRQKLLFWIFWVERTESGRAEF